MQLISSFPLALLLLMGSLAQAGEMQPYVGSAEFEKMKKLNGTWTGTSSSAKEGEQVTVIYKVSSAGSTVVETFFPGKPYEMVSVYHDINGKLGMTHYCALRNQPNLALRQARKNKLEFDYAGGTNLDPAKDTHMHALQIEFIDDNNIVQKWTQFEGGKENGVNTLALERVNQL